MNGGGAAMVKCMAAYCKYKTYAVKQFPDKAYKPIGQMHQFTALMDQVDGMKRRRRPCNKKGFQCEVYMGMSLLSVQ
jgi:hypothetical protein